MDLDAGVERVREVLSDYGRLSGLSGAIVESEVVERRVDGSQSVRTLARVCVLVFCKTMRQMQHVQRETPDRFVATVIPDESDFRYGRIVVELARRADSTGMRMHSELEPAFWVPPLLGPWLVRRALEQESRAGVEGIEHAALAP